MTVIPENSVLEKDLSEWYHLQEELKKVKASEMLLRQRIFGAYFPSPKEGTNDAPLNSGYLLKGKYTINREVDPGALGALKDKLLEAGIKADALVHYKPSLVLREYRTLTNEQQQLFDQCLIVRPGSPSLEIVLPAKLRTKE